MSTLDNKMGGMVHATLNICRMLARRGVEVELASTVGNGDDLAYLEEQYPEVACRLFRRTIPHHYFNSLSLRRWLMKHAADFQLVHVHGTFSLPTLYACRAAGRRGVPYFMQPHGSLDPWDLQKHRHAKRRYGDLVLRPLLDKAAALVLTANLEADRAVLYGASTPKSVAPLPVEFATAAQPDKARARQRMSIPSDAVVVLFLGRFDWKKGLQFLIPALGGLKATCPQLWFLLAGSGNVEEEKEVDSLLDHYSMKGWTTTTGFVSGLEKQSVYAASDIFALPSLNENFGITVIEALRARLALVISTEVYIASLLEAEGVAALCDPSAHSCSAALADLLKDSGRVRRMADGGPSVAERHFSTEAAFRALMKVYASVGYD